MNRGIVMRATRSLAFAAAAAALGAPLHAGAQDAVAFFQRSCTACHTIGGGRRVGPDLKGVTGRKDRAWLVHFITDPAGVLASGDPYALKLKQEMNGAVMTPVPGMTPAVAESLLDYIQSQSGTAVVKAGTPSEPPVSSAESALGRDLFTGLRPLSGGGPPCLSCHGAGALSGLGGGLLGPDLTGVATRLGGGAGLSAWLRSPPTPTMRTVFGKKPLTAVEVVALSALLRQLDAAGDHPPSPLKGHLLLGGAGGATVLFLFFGWAWRGRLRAVRRPMVDARGKGDSHGRP